MALTLALRDTVARLMAHLLRRRLLLAALLLVAVVLVLVAPMFMLAMAPAIALFAMVAGRLMPGEELIVRLRTRHAAARRPRAIALQRPYDALVVRRAGRLIASALAMRPPPARLPITS
jgi:hypothetical protein